MAWTDTLDNEMRAYAANKGWDRLEPDAAAQAVVKSYRELERLRPEAPPREAAGYVFDVKKPDGTPADAAHIERARSLAFELKLPQVAATQLATRLVTQAADEAKTVETARTQALADGNARLDTAWGADRETRLEAARRAFDALALPKETVDALVGQLGIDKVMQTGYDLSQKMGEASFHRGDPNVNQNQAWTRETALAERNRLINDKAFYTKFMDGDAEAVKQFNAVTTAILGTPESWQAPPENFGRQGDGAGHEIQPGHSKWDDRRAS